jgi:hypothetical protein
MEKSRPVTCRASMGAGMPGAAPAAFRASLRSGIKGLALKVPWLVTAGHDATWIAFGVWALVFTAMLASLTRSFRRAGPAGRAAGA